MQLHDLIHTVASTQYIIHVYLTVQYCPNKPPTTKGLLLTVLVSLARSGTTPWSVITPRFSSSLAILAIAAHTLARTSRSKDLSRPTMSSRPPTKDRTSSPASLAFSIQGQMAQAAHACTCGAWKQQWMKSYSTCCACHIGVHVCVCVYVCNKQYWQVRTFSTQLYKTSIIPDTSHTYLRIVWFQQWP